MRLKHIVLTAVVLVCGAAPTTAQTLRQQSENLRNEMTLDAITYANERISEADERIAELEDRVAYLEGQLTSSLFAIAEIQEKLQRLTR